MNKYYVHYNLRVSYIKGVANEIPTVILEYILNTKLLHLLTTPDHSVEFAVNNKKV